ncbi:hypothetical protein [Subtercola sp. YIM 133946]|uniref:hypothetical protein n=1 Tax=Subtercola sp. YIM 133946 TaxID=3118909 RepID=UPI002F93CBF3
MLRNMTMKHAHLSSRAVVAMVAVSVTLGALTLASSASAATSHFKPVAESPVAVGNDPEAVAYDPNPDSATGHPRIYVANRVDGDVIEIDAVTRALVGKPIVLKHSVGVTNPEPCAITVDAKDDLVLVANCADDSVGVIDGATNNEQLSSPRPVGQNPDAIAWDSVNGLVDVASYIDGTVSQFDPTRNTVATVVKVGDPMTSKPEGIAVDPASRQVFVALQGDDALVVLPLDLSTQVRLTDDLHSPNAVAVDSARGQVYVANYDSSTVTVFGATSGSELAGSPVTVGTNPNALAVDPGTGILYVADFNTGASMIDETSLLVVATVGNQKGAGKPAGVTVDPTDHTAFFANQATANVTALQQTESPTITSGNPVAGTVGDAYRFEFTATGIPMPTDFSLAGRLPAGLTFAGGVISGTPTESGDFVITLTVSNGVDPVATAQYTLHIDAVAPPTTTPTTPPTKPGGHLPTVAG